MSYRVGFDVGGTFTDFVLQSPAGELITGKRLTTYPDPSEACLAGLDALLARAGVAWADIGQAVHGTTLGSNYLEQGRYAEAIASTGAEPDLVDTAPSRAMFVSTVIAALPGAGGGVALLDADGDGDLDIFAASSAGDHLFSNDGGRWTDITATALGAPEIEDRAGLGWHVRMAPRLVPHGGFEESTGLALHSVFPERAAELLREVGT